MLSMDLLKCRETYKFIYNQVQFTFYRYIAYGNTKIIIKLKENNTVVTYLRFILHYHFTDVKTDCNFTSQHTKSVRDLLG
jgi:hypothetical protein